MDITNFYYDPLFYAILLPILLVIGVMVYCRKTGSPKFIRGWIGVKGAFHIRIVIKELRANYYRIFETMGRRWIRPDKTETYQTVRFGDIPAPTLEEVEEAETTGLVTLEKIGANNYRVLKTNIVEGDDGKKHLEEERISMEDRILWRDESRDSDIKYKEMVDNWLKFLPIITILITALGIGIILYLNVGALNDMSGKNTVTAESMNKMSGHMEEIVRIIYGKTPPKESALINYTY